MADSRLNTLRPNQGQGEVEKDDLNAVLRDMPTKEWWEESDQAFSKISDLLRFRTESILGDQLDGDADEYARNARLVRESSLPSFTLLPAHNYLLRLTATPEPLQCLAFGTMGSKLFIELFWESVTRGQHTGDEILVHLLEGANRPILRILLSLRLQGSARATLFEILYVQCEALVHRYPKIVDAPVEFLEENCTQTVLDLVKGLHEYQRRIPDERHRRTYHYLRAWGIIQGVYNVQSYQKMLSLCTALNWEKDEAFHIIVSRCLNNYDSGTGSEMGYHNCCNSANDWIELLRQLEQEPFQKRFEFRYYLRVAMMYTGSSTAKGAEWIYLVDRKIHTLKERLEVRLTQEPKQEISLWPHRLVSTKSDLEDDVYEGYYVIGLHCHEFNTTLAIEVADRWVVQMQNDPYTIQSQCYINVTLCKGASDFEKEPLKRDFKKWPLPIVKPDDNHRRLDEDPEEVEENTRVKIVLGNQKRGNDSQTSSDAPKGARLRPAGDILKRLRHDRQYNIDECVVGYKDRHNSRILEKPAVDWASETTDEEFIPEHRIEYFKRGGEVIWDKASKLDKVFLSGNSEIER